MGVAEQLRMRSVGVTDCPLVSLRSTETVTTTAGGEQTTHGPMAALAKAGQLDEQEGTPQSTPK